jgi:23S rRNA pseudouridine1911/1915/1917 synthase
MKNSNKSTDRDDATSTHIGTSTLGHMLLYEDDVLVVFNKSPNLPTQPTQNGEDSLLTMAENWMGQPLFVVHRLDQPASGIVVFGKTAKAAAHLNAQFQNRETTKTYWAIVEKKAWKAENTEGVLVDYLQHNPKKNQSFVVKSDTPNAKRAELHWLLRGGADHYNLLEINLLTGRHHQIRVQLSAFGCPVKGDVKYHARRGNPDRSIHLHARFLRLKHPISNVDIELVAEPPKDVLWERFLEI